MRTMQQRTQSEEIDLEPGDFDELDTATPAPEEDDIEDDEDDDDLADDTADDDTADDDDIEEDSGV